MARTSDGQVGVALTALCGGALALTLLLVIGLMSLLAWHGLAYFWQSPVVAYELHDGRQIMGELREREPIPAEQTEGSETKYRLRLRLGNLDLTGQDFRWIDESEVKSRHWPENAVLLERREWGPFYGFPVALRTDEETIATDLEEIRRNFAPLHRAKLEEQDAIRDLEKGRIGRANYEIENLRLERRGIEKSGRADPETRARLEEIARLEREAQSRYEELATELSERRRNNAREQLVVAAADGTEVSVPVAEIVRAVYPNDLGVTGSIGLYASRLWEFVAAEPRASNTEGGVFPAIFGTVLMVFLMSFAVTPLGVLAAVYLREYAKQGAMVRAVRIAVNNLAGVPSIVFGVFGLGFFVYMIGGSIDQLFYSEALPTPTYGTGGILWAALTLALLTVPVVIVATEEGLAAVPRIVREGSLALGATKSETTFKVVVPAAAPGILTGMILAMARAAGEVAPLMIVGMVKLAPALPVDSYFPFIHFDRKFMHLGFHIYDVGFQSPNVEASKPLVYATALLLVLVVTLMNLVAIWLRNHLRKKYASSAV